MNPPPRRRVHPSRSTRRCCCRRPGPRPSSTTPTTRSPPGRRSTPPRRPPPRRPGRAGQAAPLPGRDRRRHRLHRRRRGSRLHRDDAAHRLEVPSSRRWTGPRSPAPRSPPTSTATPRAGARLRHRPAALAGHLRRGLLGRSGPRRQDPASSGSTPGLNGTEAPDEHPDDTTTRPPAPEQETSMTQETAIRSTGTGGPDRGAVGLRCVRRGQGVPDPARRGARVVGIDLEVARGEFVSLVGARAAARRRCLRILSGLLAPSGGARRGRRPAPPGPPAVARRRSSPSSGWCSRRLIRLRQVSA